METLSSAEERRLLDGVKQAVDLVDDQGKSPNEALTKVARDFSWSRGQLRSAVSAFNNGRQVAQWDNGADLMAKLADFPLADYDLIHDAIWGKAAAEKVAADRLGISPEYSLPPSFVRDPYREMLLSRDLAQMTKTAAWEPGTRHPSIQSDEHAALVDGHLDRMNMVEAYHHHQREKRAFEEARSQFSRAHDTLRVKLGLLENYFKKSAMDRLAFPLVDKAVQVYYGTAGEALMDSLAASFPREKRGSDADLRTSQPIARASQPFLHVEQAIAAAREVYRTKTAMDEAYVRLEKAAEARRPFVQSPSATNQEEPLSFSLFKEAGMFGDATKGILEKSLGGAAKKDIQDESLNLEEPEHENELRKIQAQAMLSEMMSDPDNPISGHDPDEVLAAYNKISKLSPRASTQPLATQTMLHKALSGGLEPFEVNDMNTIEKGVQKTHGSPLGVGLLGAKPFDVDEANRE